MEKHERVIVGQLSSERKKKKEAVVIFCKRKISFSDDCSYINPPNVY